MKIKTHKNWVIQDHREQHNMQALACRNSMAMLTWAVFAASSRSQFHIRSQGKSIYLGSRWSYNKNPLLGYIHRFSSLSQEYDLWNILKPQATKHFSRLRTEPNSLLGTWKECYIAPSLQCYWGVWFCFFKIKLLYSSLEIKNNNSHRIFPSKSMSLSYGEAAPEKM